MYTAVWILAVIVTVCDGAVLDDPVRMRVKREPAQKDEATEERTNRVDIPDVELTLSPGDEVDLMEGDDITFNCKITNKPRESQVQWYYMIRNPVDNSFDNFTILANEMATVDIDKYSVWTTPPNLYSLKINQMRSGDSGEYCCFLYVSYSETYRQTTTVKIHDKLPPPTTTPRAVRHGSGSGMRYRYGIGSPQASTPSPNGFDRIDEIIEEAVEHDMEAELGRTLNISMIKNNPKALTLIHNATKEIKSLLNVNEETGAEFNNGTTRLTVTRQMNGVRSEVKTVVTTLIRRISRVDDDLAQAFTPLQTAERGGQTDPVSRSRVSNVARAPNAIPDWRRLYNEYKRGQPGTTGASSEIYIDNTISEEPGYNVIPNTLPHQGRDSRGELEMEEERDNIIESQSESREHSYRESSESSEFPGKKCQYQLVINEFDPSQCPSIGSNRDSAAAMYYETDNRKAAAFTELPIGNAQPPPASNDQLVRIENRLMEEMANSKMVNKTVLMHDSMLHRTEKMLEKQTDNITKLEELVKNLKTKLSESEEEKLDMEEKVSNVMLNIVEVNKRLDIAMQKKGTGYDGKEIGVLSASETVTCDRHPNVTHYKDCAEAALDGNAETGVYYIRPLYSACPIPVWCDMDTYPGGWTVVQRREGGGVSFNREWEPYRRGFGEVTGEHWLGNDNLFLLSNQQEYMMRVDLWDFYDSRVFSEYRTFKVDGERDGYKLTIGNYSGTAGDGLKSHNKQKFSTSDRDHDMWQDYHCAYEWEGGWWFTNCWSSYLNGRYYNVSNPPYNGISWREWKEEQLYKSEIKIRPVYYVRSDTPPGDEGEVEVEIDQTIDTEEEAEVQGDQPREGRQRFSAHRKYNLAPAKN